MRISSILSATTIVPVLVQAKTYYVDKSCTAKPGWDDALKETFEMARRTSERLSSSSDTDFESVFEQIMKTKKSDNSEFGFPYVKGVFDDIKSWTKVSDEPTLFETIKKADIRIFCDNDAITNDPMSLANLAGKVEGNERWSKRPTFWWDFKNDIRSTNEKPRCQRLTNSFGYTSNRKVPLSVTGNMPELRKGQNPTRVVVTICDASFVVKKVKSSTGREIERPITLTDAVKNRKYDNVPINWWTSLISVTLLHEFAHAATNNKIDDLPSEDKCYGWTNVFNNPLETARLNAENYAYLGLWAMMADLQHGYTLDRLHVDDSITDPAERERRIKESQDRRQRGRMTHYADLTKRALYRIAKLFRA